MAKDPAFLFYPGDYLRDTQCLSENAQVAYDRIMCEHMRNICISKTRLKFFTKRLNDEELEELMSVLIETDKGFHIEWVSLSVEKRKAYSESRRNNRKKRPEDMTNISVTYDPHMENENENEIKNNIKKEIDPRVVSVFDHYVKIFKKSKATKLTPVRIKLIERAFKRGHDVEILLKAITGMSNDDWEGRVNNDDLVYAIGDQKGIDKVVKWASYEPPKVKSQNYSGEGEDYDEEIPERFR